ncbi:MAG TPA: hypothetical protein ENK02_08455 [Planctomycetes bacterium]|nr:hypothetical protein [Planctomycetota bacterium]
MNPYPDRVLAGKKEVRLSARPLGEHRFQIQIEAKGIEVRAFPMQCGGDVLETPDGKRVRFFATATPKGIQVRIHGRTWMLPSVASIREREGAQLDPHKLEAPLTGTILALLVQEGQEVEEGEELLLLSAMKMEHKLRSQASGKVKTIHVQVGDTVDAGSLLLEMEDETDPQ